MTSNHWVGRWAVAGLLVAVFAAGASADEDPFGVVDGESRAAKVLAAETAAPAATPVEQPGESTATHCRCVGDADSPSAARIEKALRSPLTATGLDFADTPLDEVVNVLQEEYDIPIQIDVPALEAIGLGPDEAVTLQVRNVSLKSALRLMLERKQLTYMLRDEVLLITTPEEAESDLLTCVYDVRNLVDKPPEPKGATAWADYNPLIGAITHCIAPDTWRENGKGEGDIRAIGSGALVIYQTRAVHEQITQMLTTLRELRQSPPPGH